MTDEPKYGDVFRDPVDGETIMVIRYGMGPNYVQAVVLVRRSENGQFVGRERGEIVGRLVPDLDRSARNQWERLA